MVVEAVSDSTPVLRDRRASHRLPLPPPGRSPDGLPLSAHPPPQALQRLHMNRLYQNTLTRADLCSVTKTNLLFTHSLLVRGSGWVRPGHFPLPFTPPTTSQFHRQSAAATRPAAQVQTRPMPAPVSPSPATGPAAPPHSGRQQPPRCDRAQRLQSCPARGRSQWLTQRLSTPPPARSRKRRPTPTGRSPHRPPSGRASPSPIPIRPRPAPAPAR